MSAEEATPGAGFDGTWYIAIAVDEDEARTVATATLTTNTRRLQGRGMARRNPADPNLPRVGEDLAVARALSELSHTLLSDAVSQLEVTTHMPAGIARI